METGRPPATIGPRAEIDDLRAELDRRGFAAVRVEGGCMSPALRPGEAALVHRRRRPRVGDVVLIDVQGLPETHRLIGRLGSRFLHAGDASAEAGLASEAQVLGLVETPPRPVWAWLKGCRAFFLSRARKAGSIAVT